MLSMAKVSKNELEVWRSISVPKIFLPGSYKFRNFFFDHGSSWRNEYGHFSRKSTPAHASISIVPLNVSHPVALHETRLGRMSLKKCVFGCKGKITLFSFPKEPSVTWTVDAVCFSGQQRSFSSVFVDERFINKAQFDTGFAHRLILKDGAVPAIKDPGHDSELQTVSEKASNIYLLAIGT